MATKAPAIVRGRDGLLGTIIDPETDSSGGPEATVDVLLDDGRRLLIPSRFLSLRSDGGYDLALSVEEVARLSRDVEGGEVVVPVIAEEVEVGKRRVESGRVRVRKTVRSTEKVVDEPVVREEVEVERVPINRVIAEAVGPRQEGDTLIVPLLEEVLVVEKRLMLREEVRITRRRVERRSSRKITLRSEEATVERIEGDGGPAPVEEGHASVG
jgi:uncharacterized protein (TIGR02271 family)